MMWISDLTPFTPSELECLNELMQALCPESLKENQEESGIVSIDDLAKNLIESSGPQAFFEKCEKCLSGKEDGSALEKYEGFSPIGRRRYISAQRSRFGRAICFVDPKSITYKANLDIGNIYERPYQTTTEPDNHVGKPTSGWHAKSFIASGEIYGDLLGINNEDKDVSRYLKSEGMEKK